MMRTCGYQIPREMKIHYGHANDDTFTRCGKVSHAGRVLVMTTNIKDVTCKLCLAAFGAIKHPSSGKRRW
jgi:hypothetical protein